MHSVWKLIKTSLLQHFLIFALPKIIILVILAPKRRIDIFFGVEFQMRHFRKFSNTMRRFFQTQVHEDGIFLANDFLSFNSISTGRCIIFSLPKMTNSAFLLFCFQFALDTIKCVRLEQLLEFHLF